MDNVKRGSTIFVTVLSTLPNIVKSFIIRPRQRGMVLRSIYGKKPENRGGMPKATQQTSIGAKVQTQATWLRAHLQFLHWTITPLVC